MAAYATLLSLTNTINQIQNHPRPPISLNKIKIEPLIEKVGFLQDFLENYTIDDDADDLEGRMVDAANEAEDIIESHIADHIGHIRDHIRNEYEGSLYQYIQKMTMEESDEAEDITESQIAHHIEEEARDEANKDDKSCLYGELQKVINDLDFMTKDVAAAIKDKAGKKIAPKDDATTDDVMNHVILDKLTISPYSERAGGSNNVMNDVMGKLTDQQSSRWIIAIAGMGGIGKTTLAKNIYEHPLIVEHFDMRGWSTISQEFNSKRVLLEVLHCVGCIGSEDNEYEELGQKLYQNLIGRRYLIVMDDIWGTDAWDEMKRFFPNNNKGSRVLITTRSLKVALQLDGPGYFQMIFLKLDESWKNDDTNDVMNNVMGNLVNRQSTRWIIGIAGMGGIGKTTLAKNIYECRLIVEHFDMRGWTTISQEFNSKRVLLEILHCIGCIGSEESEYEELGNKLYRSLFKRRYLIVMDDIWSTDAWDEMKRFFPNNDDGSRVLITTRASKVALHLDGPNYFQMPFLEVDESWNLLRRCVFGEEQQGSPPPELEAIGKNIATNCRGLPLSIVVIGGLLAKSEQTRENWQRVLENLSSTVNLEEDERCFKILKLSYDQLPVHLKPCFLYMGMYREDDWINVSMLMRLWVDEGFVKPVAGKSLETIARVVYLNDLVLRNLIVVRERGCNGRIKRCSIHDLLRDLCIKEAEKYKFLRTTHDYPDHDQSWCAQCRISSNQPSASKMKYTISPDGPFLASPLPEAVQSASRVRTLISDSDQILPSFVPFRLLRVLHGYIIGGEFFHMVNLRHLNFKFKQKKLEFPPEFYLLWNLQTLSIYHTYKRRCDYATVLDIWRMPQLRHVMIYDRFQLTDPPPKEIENGCWMVLENLETLERVLNFKCNEEVVERIPNIKNLGIEYYDEEEVELSSPGSDYGLNNLCRLHKLESLSLSIFSRKSDEVVMMMTLPVTLRKLSLSGMCLEWEEMGTKIGSLPSLETLNLCANSCVGLEWETAEGGFQSLRYLQIDSCSDLEQWRVEATHFPCLEQLELKYLDKLKEIPLGIGEITTLREIKVVDCSASVVLSARKILEEQLECFGKVDLHITVPLVGFREKRGKNAISTTKKRYKYFSGLPDGSGPNPSRSDR